MVLQHAVVDFAVDRLDLAFDRGVLRRVTRAQVFDPARLILQRDLNVAMIDV